MRSPLPLHRHSWNVPWHHVMLWCVMGLVTGMQTVWSQAERISHWSTWMQGERPDLTSTLDGFQSQAEYRTSPRSTGEKPFLRWAWWMTERGGHHGSPKPSSWWYAASQWKNKNVSLATMPSGNEWTYVVQTRFLCMEALDGSIKFKSTQMTQATGLPVHLQAVCGTVRTKEDIGTCLASILWPPLGASDV